MATKIFDTRHVLIIQDILTVALPIGMSLENYSISLILGVVSFLCRWRQSSVSHSKEDLALFLWFQSDLEKREGLPVSPFMDRDKVNKNSSQVNFIRFVLLPLFDSLADLYPTIQVCVWRSVNLITGFTIGIVSTLQEQEPKLHGSKICYGVVFSRYK